jgi:hypothetical protein
MCTGQGYYELGGWSNCNHGTHNAMQIRIKTAAAPVIDSTAHDMACPESAGWNTIMHIEDDPTQMDMPKTAGLIGAGFDNANAQYIGNSALNALSFSQAEICFGKKSQCSSINCMPITAQNVGAGITQGHYTAINGLNSDFKKLLGCFTGQCPPDNGDSYSNGFFFECHDASCRCSDFGFNSAFSGQPWSVPGSGAYTCGVGPHASSYPVHFWGSGYTMCTGQGNYEVGGWSNCNHGTIDSMYIRVK